MALLGKITLNEIKLMEVDEDPRIMGLDAPSGSVAFITDGSGYFIKGEGDNFDWTNPVETITEATKEPTGFVNRTDSSISFNEITRVFSIQPVGISFDIFIKGKKISITEPLQTTIPDVSGANFLYINASGQLLVSDVFTPDLFSEYAYVSYLLWDAEDNKAIVLAEERHGIVMDAATHTYLHTTQGTKIRSGGSIISNISAGGTLNTSAQVGYTNVQISDEDITINITHSNTPTNYFEQQLQFPAKIPLFYRSGPTGIWKKLEATTYPIKYGTNRAVYNSFSGGNWGLTDAEELNHLATFIFATNDINNPVIGILGQGQDLELVDAKDSLTWDSLNFGVLPFLEFKLLHRIIYKTSSLYINDVKSEIVDVSDYRFNVDRSINILPITNNHSELAGLTNDDHLQYLIRTGVRPMTGNLDMGNNNITNTDLINGINILSHAARHLPNGTDPLDTGVPSNTGTANSVGTANAFARQDHVHNTVLISYSNSSTTGTTNSTTSVTLLTIPLPNAGTYVVNASIVATHGSNNGALVGALYVGGVLVTGTNATLTKPGNTNSHLPYIITTKITVDGTNNVELRWNTNTGTLTNRIASISLIRVG